MTTTINEQLVDRFKHNDTKEGFKGGLLKIVRPDDEMKEHIVDNIRYRIIKKFSKPDSVVDVFKGSLEDLIEWYREPKTAIEPTPADRKVKIDGSDTGYYRYNRLTLTYPWLEADDALLGTVAVKAYLEDDNNSQYQVSRYTVESYSAHVINLTDLGWRKLADWLSEEGLNVKLRTRSCIVGIRREAFFKAHLLKKKKCYGLTIRMNKEKEELRKIRKNWDKRLANIGKKSGGE